MALSLCIGNRIGGGGISWSSYWATLISATVENAAPTNVVLTFSKANTNLVASDFTIAGFTIITLTRDATNKILTLTLSTSVVYGDSLTVVFGKTGDSQAVTNNISAEAEMITLLAAYPTQPTTERKKYLNRFIKNLKASGVWGEWDAAWLLRSHSQDCSLINIKNPGIKDCTAVGSPTFTVDGGYTFASGKYLNTNFTPSTDGVNYTLDDCSLGIWLTDTSSAADMIDIGGRKTTPVVIWAGIYGNFGANGAIYRLNSLLTNFGQTKNPELSGLYHAERTSSTALKLWVNGANSDGESKASNALLDIPIYIGCGNLNNSSTESPSTRTAYMAYIGGALTAAQKRSLSKELYMLFNNISNEYAEPTTSIFDDTKLIDGAVYTDETTYKTHTPFTSFQIQTNATMLRIGVKPTSALLPYQHLTIFKNGVLNRRIKIVGEDTFDYFTGGGTNVIKIMEDMTTVVSSPMQGIYIKSILSNGSVNTIQNTDPSERICIVADSIGVGANADYGYNGWGGLFQQNSHSVNYVGGGSNSINLCAGDASKRSTLVTRIDELMDGSTTNKLVIALGTNDYGLPACSAANFQTYYDALLQAINTARSDISIFCLTPFVRTTESANSYGDTLGAYRTAINNAAAGKAYCTVIDGSGILATPDDLDTDGVHPSTAGHNKAYAALTLIV